MLKSCSETGDKGWKSLQALNEGISGIGAIFDKQRASPSIICYLFYRPIPDPGSVKKNILLKKDLPVPAGIYYHQNCMYEAAFVSFAYCDDFFVVTNPPRTKTNIFR